METNPDQVSETESVSFKFVPAAARPLPDESEVPCSGALHASESAVTHLRLDTVQVDSGYGSYNLSVKPGPGGPGDQARMESESESSGVP